MRKIRTKLIICLLFVALLPLVALAIISWRDIYRTRIQSISEFESSIAFQTGSQVKKLINDKLLGVRIKIVDPRIDSFEKIGEEQQRLILTDLLKTDPSLETVDLLDLEGKMRKKFLKGGIEAEPETLSFKTTEGFQWALQGKAYLGKVIFENNTPKTALVSPVVNPEGKVIAVLMVGVDLSMIQELIGKIKIGETGYLYLVDKDGNIIAHSKNPELIGKNVKEEEIKGVQAVILKQTRLGLEREDRYPGLSKEKVIGATLPIQEFNWGIVVEWPEKEALAIVQTILFSTLKISLIILLGILVMAFIFAQGISKPIQKIRKGANIIGMGSFGYRIKIKTGDELEELGESFNKMAEDLKEVERLREIEIKTKALAETLAREKELSEMKDKFIKTASHQLRTPVTVIKWILELLKEQKGVLTKEMKNYLNDAYKSSKNLTTIVNDLISVSEFGLGYYKKENPRPIDIVEVTDNLIDGFKTEIKEKKIKFEFEKPTESFLVSSTLRAMRQVIQNLIDNAVCYTKKGGEIKVFLKKIDGKVEFRIKDTGIGIPKAEQKMVFSQFFRASNSVEQKSVGTGLGLYMTKNIVEGHGGEIRFESGEAKGSTFYFILPLIRS